MSWLAGCSHRADLSAPGRSWKSYLRKQLVAYRSGKRQNLIMNGFAKDLSDAEIRALADFYGAR